MRMRCVSMRSGIDRWVAGVPSVVTSRNGMNATIVPRMFLNACHGNKLMDRLSRMTHCSGGIVSFRKRFLPSRRSATLAYGGVVASSADFSEPDFRAVASLVVDECENRNAKVIGLGTGKAIEEILVEIARRNLKISCVPTSDFAAAEAAMHGIPIVASDGEPKQIDIMIDVADEIDVSYPGFAYVIGRGENGTQAGQASLTNMRDLRDFARFWIVLAAEKDTSAKRLRGDVPVLIQGDKEAWEDTAEILDDIFLGDAEIRRRSFDASADPRGGDAPVITSEGNMLIDIQFYEDIRLFGEPEPYEKVVEEIELTEGVVAHGLILDNTDMVIVAMTKGPPIVIKRGEEISLPYQDATQE